MMSVRKQRHKWEQKQKSIVQKWKSMHMAVAKQEVTKLELLAGLGLPAGEILPEQRLSSVFPFCLCSPRWLYHSILNQNFQKYPRDKSREKGLNWELENSLNFSFFGTVVEFQCCVSFRGTTVIQLHVHILLFGLQVVCNSFADPLGL